MWGGVLLILRMSEVSLSGSFLSSLLFKLKNAAGDTDGLLLGKVCSHQVDNITDSQSAGQKEERKICFHSSISFDKKHSFYSHACVPNFDKVDTVLGARSMDLIGWFSYRRNSSHRLSMKEKALHRKLVETIKHLQSKDFLLFLITDEFVDMSAVSSTEYSFHSWDISRFRVVGSKMLTLPSSVPYQVLPSRVLPQHLMHYNQVLAQQRLHFSTSSGDVQQSKTVEELCVALLQKLEPLKEELTSVSERVRETSRKVAELRHRVALVEKEKEASSSSSGQILEDGTEAVPSTSTAMLIDLNENMSPSHEDSYPPLTPSLQVLGHSNSVLVPEKATADTGLQNSTHKQDQSHQYLSQELF